MDSIGKTRFFVNSPLNEFLDRFDYCEYFEHITALPAKPCVSINRVSSHQQSKGWSLSAQILQNTKAILSQGAVIPLNPFDPKYPFNFEWSGHGYAWWYKLKDVRKRLDDLGANACITMVDRAARHPGYISNHPTRWSLQATRNELDAMQDALGRKPYCILPPNTKAAECKQFSIGWAKDIKTASKAPLDQFKSTWLPAIQFLRNQPLSQIQSHLFHVSRRYVSRNALAKWMELAIR